ncbi:MAG: hypothetical protein N4A36_03785 [Candidatus Gracilibacteria bacterium]|jgi:glucose-6-phosphate isomerase|nr:hypothetical protein [Candidatus Gracilibacteria bacterium]
MKLKQENIFKSEPLKTECLALVQEFADNSPDFFRILDKEDEQSEIQDFADKNRYKWKNIVICGIGGSALGTKAVLSATGKGANITILETINQDEISKILKKDISKTLFVFISKSGGTLETVSQYFFFRNLIEEKGLKFKDHAIFITGDTGYFREISDTEGAISFEVPDEVSGRFSVFTSVGLVPLAFAGVSIKTLIKGAKKARKNALLKNNKNTALKMALAEHESKRSISVMFLYSDKLYDAGRFWRQLLAESIGKTPETDITPHICIGTREQHSDLQLFIEGADNKLYTFIQEDFDKKIKLPEIKDKDYSYLSGKTFQKLLNTSLIGTSSSLLEQSKPVQFVNISKINTESIAELLFTFEAEIAYLGKILNLNTFNQPGVERGKHITKEILKNEK